MSFFDFNHDGEMDAFESAAEFMFLQNTAQEAELEENGLDADEVAMMDEDERRQALEDAGLDPDDFDF